MDKSPTRDSSDSLLVQTKRRLRQFGLKPRKGLGQHFLVDEEVLEVITSAAELTPDDLVVEVGPGLGILTEALARKAGGVIAIELDDKLAALLKKTLLSFKNVTIVNDNVLNIESGELLAGRGVNPVYKVVANLPYYITSPVLRHFLEASARPQVMIFMVQKEVAEAVAARPGDMSLLSVSVQFYGKPEIVSYVPAQSFYPAPAVDSAVLRIELYAEPAVAVSDEGGFFELVRAGFAAPRKQIANSLSQGLGLPRDVILPLLEKADIASQRRAETLTLEEWARLCRVFEEKRDGRY
ncbi:MAG: ribosomal RNA small subunit methyltransferase A [Deltaproteobacteria bacterium]|nr:ribosomal RNA small subunit methyltransferase A [Deltaproteobacteria bacterium]